jgi:hypothetical protein
LYFPESVESFPALLRWCAVNRDRLIAGTTGPPVTGLPATGRGDADLGFLVLTVLALLPEDGPPPAVETFERAVRAAAPEFGLRGPVLESAIQLAVSRIARTLHSGPGNEWSDRGLPGFFLDGWIAGRAFPMRRVPESELHAALAEHDADLIVDEPQRLLRGRGGPRALSDYAGQHLAGLWLALDSVGGQFGKCAIEDVSWLGDLNRSSTRKYPSFGRQILRELVAPDRVIIDTAKNGEYRVSGDWSFLWLRESPDRNESVLLISKRRS